MRGATALAIALAACGPRPVASADLAPTSSEYWWCLQADTADGKTWLGCTPYEEDCREKRDLALQSGGAAGITDVGPCTWILAMPAE